MKVYITCISLFLTSICVSQTDKPAGWKPCEVIKDSMLVRLETKMRTLKASVAYDYNKDAHILSIDLKYREHLIKNGKCTLQKKGTHYFERWEAEEYTMQGFFDFWRGMVLEKRTRKRKQLRVKLSGFDF